MNEQGLDNKEWQGAPSEDAAPIDLLADSERHTYFRSYIKDRLEMSERKMSRFYPRWRANEKRVQGYIDLKDFERELKQITDTRGAPPAPVTITIPYTYATIATIVTYYVHTFTGRKTIFQIGTTNGEMVTAAQHMETVLQHNIDRKQMIRIIFQFLTDAEIACRWRGG